MRNIRWMWVLVIAAIVVALDQWTKSAVEARVPLWGTYAPLPALASYFNLAHYQNSGAAFGLLRGGASFFIVVAVVVAIILVVYSRHLAEDSWPMRIALGLMLGGALGNLIDRITQDGHVTDFLLFSVPVGGRLYQWPAFNVADSAIVCGTILLALLLLRSETGSDKAEKVNSTSEGEAGATE